MKDAAKKYWALILVFVMVTGVCALFSYRKSGMFIDEIYSYGLANSHYAPFVTSIKGGDMVDTVLTRQELTDYLSVGADDKFDFGSVYYNQTQDVHPPLYYWLLNAASSLTGTGFTKWTGLALNYLIYMLTLFFLCKLVLTLFGSLDNAAATAVLYGLSVIGMSTMVMIRMYALLTLFTVLLAYFVARLMKEKRGWLYFAVGLTVFAGLMTQYYFVFYAFFLCAAYDIYALVKREYRSLILFSLSAFIGVGALVAAFPACLTQLFANTLVSGGSAVQNLLDLSMYAFRIDSFYESCIYIKALRNVFYAAIALLLILSPRLVRAAKESKISLQALVICLPAPLTFILVAIVSPVIQPRYIYNIIPIIVLGVSFLFYLLESSLGQFRHSYAVKKLAVLLIAAAALWEAKWLPPDYLYPEHKEYDRLLSQYSDSPCVCFDDNYPASVTQNILQLLNFEDVFVANDAASEKLADYIGDAERAVVYVDISQYWSSGFDADEILAQLSASFGFTECRPLYDYELTKTYILSK